MRSYPVEELVSSLQKSLSDEMERYTLLESKYYDLKKQLDEALVHLDKTISESSGGFSTADAYEFLQKMNEKAD